MKPFKAVIEFLMNIIGLASLFISLVTAAMLLLHQSSKSKFSMFHFTPRIIRDNLKVQKKRKTQQLRGVFVLCSFGLVFILA